MNTFVPEEQLSGVWTGLLSRFRVVIIVSLAILTFGIMSFHSIPRETEPTVEIPAASIMTIWPGASPTDIESLVTNVLEEKLENLENVEEMSSVSQSGVSIISVEFESGTDKTENLQKLRDRVDEATRDLPNELPEAPEVSEVSISDIPILSLTVSGDYAWSELKRYAEVIQDGIETISKVKRVSVSGAPVEEIQIALDPLQLQAKKISVSEVISALRGNNLDLPLGTVESRDQRIEISLKGALKTVEDIASLPIARKNGGLIRLQDIAQVRRGFADFDIETYFSAGESGQRAVNIDVIKSASKGNALRMVEQIYAKIEALREGRDIPENLNISTTYNRADEIRQSLDTLTGSGSQTLILIAIVMLIALGWRESFLAAVSIPLALLVAIIALQALGETFNGISLFALVLAVGLLVDNSIIVVEGMSEGITERNLTPRQAAIETIKTFRWPILTGTLTTIFAFLPMLFFITGISGDYIRIIPISIILVLVGAFFISLFLLPAIGILFYNGKSSGRWAAEWGTFLLLGYLVISLIFALPKGAAGLGNWLKQGALLGLLGAAWYAILWGKKKIQNRENPTWEGILNAFPLSLKPGLEGEENPAKPTLFRVVWGLLFWVFFGLGLGVLFTWRVAMPLSILKWALIVLLGLIAFTFLRWNYRRFLALSYAWYPRFMRWALSRGRRTGLVLLISFAVFGFSLGLLATKKVVVEIFPASDFTYFAGEVELPKGTPLASTTALIPEIEALLKPYFEGPEPIFKSVTYIAGARSNLVQEPGQIATPGESHLMGISFELTPKEARSVKSYDVAPKIEKLIAENLPNHAKFRTVQQTGGPPTGAPIEVKITGYDLTRLDAIATTVKAQLALMPELLNVRDTRAEKTLQMNWRLDRNRITNWGLTAAQLSDSLRAAASNVTAFTISEGDQDLDVKVRVSAGNEDPWGTEKTLDSIGNIPITTAGRRSVPFKEMAEPTLISQLSRINHRDGVPIVAVRADLPPGVTASEKEAEINAIIGGLELEPSESVSLGGEAEEGNRLVQEMSLAMAFAMLLILMVLIWQFKSIHQSLIVLALIPLSLTAVFIGFWLSGRPISFPTMIGIVSLAGIIVNDAIVLIDQINQNLRAGMPKTESAIKAGMARFQPILLTSITTVVGMLPLSLSDEIWGGLGFAIVYGMLLSTVLCLIVAPCLLRLWEDILRLKRWLWRYLSGQEAHY